MRHFLSKHLRKRLTLRVRLTLWVMGLLLIMGVGVLALVNMAVPMMLPPADRVAPLDIPPVQWEVSLFPKEIAVSLPTVDMPGVLRIGLGEIREWQPDLLPGELPTAVTRIYPPPEVILYMQKAHEAAVSGAQEDVFHHMHIISLIGLGVIVSLGGIGSYWLAGRALRPVQKLAQTAREIDAKTLDMRLDLKGPEDELNQLAGAFDAMLDRLEAAFERQSRFVADAAHELRTPLTTLRVSLDVVRADSNTTIEDYRAMSVTLKRALIRLQQLVDDLLLLASEEPTFQKVAVAVEPILEEVLHDLKSLADEHSVTVTLTGNDELMVEGDSSLLARVFHNLIENGIRYNRQGGEVTVNVLGEDNWTVVTVADTGSGIPAEDRSRIFDRFYRRDASRSRNGGGAGLGLSIARHIVELHGGELEVQSVVGNGSMFIVKLPAG